MSFAVVNEFWGEEVAAAVVLKSGFSEQGAEPILLNLRAVAALAPHKLTKQIIVAPSDSDGFMGNHGRITVFFIIFHFC